MGLPPPCKAVVAVYLEGEQDRCANESDVNKWSVREQDSNYVFTVTNTLQQERIQPGSVLLCRFV